MGCGDSLIPVQRPVWNAATTEEAITAALEALLALRDEFYGESGLYNALYRNDATVANVTIDDGMTTVDLAGTIPLGGTCDTPRVAGQIVETVREIAGAGDVVIRLNGQPFPPPGA